MIIKVNNRNVRINITYDEFMAQVSCLLFLGFIDHEEVRRIRNLLATKDNSLTAHGTVSSVIELLFFEMLWTEENKDDHQTTR